MKTVFSVLPAFAGVLTFAVAGSANAGSANAGPAHFSLTNNSDVVITKLEVETVAGDVWWTVEEGRLNPGETAPLVIDDGRTDCTYNFRVHYSDDGPKYRDYYGVNVCNNPAFSVP